MDRGSWRTATQILVLSALALAAVAAVILMARHRPQSSANQAGNLTQASPTASSAAASSSPAPRVSCAVAVRQANLSLYHAARVDRAMAQHTAIMKQLLAGQITPQEALNTGMVSLIHGAGFSAQFEAAYADYRAVRTRCGLTSPPPGSTPTDACARAVQGADVSFVPAFGVDAALAAHTKVMDRLLAGQITPRQALNLGGVSLVQGAANSARFDIAYRAYLQVVKQCGLAESQG